MKNNKKGFTVIEVVVSLLILAIILGMSSSVVSFFSRFYSNETTQINRQENVRLLLSYIERDIRKSNQEIDLDGTCYKIGTDDAEQQSVYCVNDSQVTRNGVVIAHEIQTLSMSTNLDGTIVNLVVAARPDTRGDTFETSYTIYLRQSIVSGTDD